MFRTLIMRVLYALASVVIFFGESIIFFLTTVFRAVWWCLVFVYNALFINVGQWIWHVVKGKRSKTRIFSINYYLLLYRIKYFAFGVLLALVVVSFFSALEFINNLPNLSILEKYSSGLSTHLYDRNGKMLYEIFHEENRTPV
ncbi:MAG: hypothetical protein NUV52_03575, partial [Candidatus Roizmanbacteria bacterium]|nr:hypothetical protein [Candidatus Roizmanbacteria bacterium]